MTPIGWITLLCWLAAAVCTGAALYTARGWPIGIRRLHQDLRDQSDSLETRWTALHRDVKAFLDAIEDQSETIERRRARVVAAQHRTKEKEKEPNGADESYDALKRRARAAGYQV